MRNLIKLILLVLILIGINSSRTVLNLGSDFPYNGTILRKFLLKIKVVKKD